MPSAGRHAGPCVIAVQARILARNCGPIMNDATEPVSVVAVTAILAAAAPVASGLFAYIQGIHQQKLEREKDERSILRDYLSMVAGADRGKNDIPKVLRYIKETSEDPAIKQWAE